MIFVDKIKDELKMVYFLQLLLSKLIRKKRDQIIQKILSN